MGFGELVNADTVSLTIVPAIVVAAVLIAWFRRREPKLVMKRPRGRFGAGERYTQTRLDEDALAAEEDELGAAIVVRDQFDNVITVKNRRAHGSTAQTPEMSDPDLETMRAELPTKRSAVEEYQEAYRGEFTRTDVAEPARESRKEKAKVSKPLLFRGRFGKSQPKEPVVVEDSEEIVDDVGPVLVKEAEANVTPLPQSKPQSKAPQPENIVAEENITDEPPRVMDKPKTAEKPAKAAEPALDGCLLLILNVLAQGRQLRGSQVLKALTGAGMSFGKRDNFHYFSPTRPSSEPVFSVANILKPGTFSITGMENMTTPGVTLYAVVERPEDAMATFTTMLDKARQLADSLDASICDERRSTLSKQGIEHIHGRIMEFQRRSRLAQAAHA